MSLPWRFIDSPPRRCWLRAKASNLIAKLLCQKIFLVKFASPFVIFFLYDDVPGTQKTPRCFHKKKCCRALNIYFHSTFSSRALFNPLQGPLSKPFRGKVHLKNVKSSEREQSVLCQKTMSSSFSWDWSRKKAFVPVSWRNFSSTFFHPRPLQLTQVTSSIASRHRFFTSLGGKWMTTKCGDSSLNGSFVSNGNVLSFFIIHEFTTITEEQIMADVRRRNFFTIFRHKQLRIQCK